MTRPSWHTIAALGLGVLIAGATGAGHAASESPTRAATAGELIESATLSGVRDEETFGSSVALSGTGRTAVVGAPGERNGGAVRVYSRSGSAWRMLVRLAPSAGSGAARFGASVGVAADGRTVLVGAPGAADDKGQAWVYRGGGGGVWVGSRLAVSSGSGKSEAGASVSLSADGRNAIVGGPGDNKGTGAVWFFRKSGSSWRQSGSKVTAGDAKGKSRFGSSVAIGFEGDAAVVGGPGDFSDRGAVWMYRRSGSVWKRQATVRPGFLAEGTKFGSRVAVSADGYTAIVGSPSSKRRMAEKRPSGDAWILRRSGSSWTTSTLGAQLGVSLEPQHVQYYGRSVAMAPDGLTAVVGGGIANRFDVVVRGGAWIYARSGGSFRGPREPIEGSSSFGASAAASYRADVIAVGSAGRVTMFSPAPIATKVAPAFGSTAGGTEVTVTGVNFTSVRGVSFGSTPAVSFSVVSPTTIRAVSPPGAAGTIHVRVTNAYGTTPERTPGLFGGPSTRFTYVAPPTITGVSPASGPPTGGTQVTITGTDLYASAVQFGGNPASFIFKSATEITAVSPPGSAGTVNVTVTTPYGTSAPNAAARFTYISPATVIGFDNITTGGPGQVLVPVTTQYAGQGVTFNSPSAIDYSKGSAIPGFARSGTVAIEHCVGVEFCTTPIRATFSAPQRLVRVYVGFSFQLNQPLQVQLRALDAQLAVVGTASTTLPVRATPTPITVPLEVSVGVASISQVEVLVPGGYNSALAVDDVTFQS